MKLSELIARKKGDINARTARYNDNVTELEKLRGADAPDEAAIEALRSDQDTINAELTTLRADLEVLERELAADEAVVRLQSQHAPSGAETRGYDQQTRTGAEERTYRQDQDPKGKGFVLDVARAFLGNGQAQQRLARHMDEEIDLRAAAGRPLVERGEERAIVGTGSFSGLVVPQYAVDMFAPAAKAGRPTANAMRKHDLPETGMQVYIGRTTTETSVDVQAAQGDAVSEADFDDTLLPVDVLTAAGSQDLSRQAIERGVGVEDTVLDDLIRGWGRDVDRKVLNRAAIGLTNIANASTYTDASPTAEELYPKLLQAPSLAEAALLDADPGDVFAVMHSRRWYWLQSQLGTKFPLFSQPGVTGNQAGVNYAERYGAGFRGVLPNGTPVIVDNNIATNLGTGTDEDEIYFVAQSEAHLWEDPNAPVLIRAEQPKAKNLAVSLVVYGYFAFTFTRRPHAQKITGTGLVTPAFA